MPRGNRRGVVLNTKKKRARIAWLIECMTLRPRECWEWPWFRTYQGYGWVHYGGGRAINKNGMAHRWVYTLLVGPIPEGMHLDHLCGNKACVNWRHLEPVTPRENTMRCKNAPATVNARKTRCPRGHPYTPENTGRSCGRRRCLTCHRARQREYMAKRKASAV